VLIANRELLSTFNSDVIAYKNCKRDTTRCSELQNYENSNLWLYAFENCFRNQHFKPLQSFLKLLIWN